MRFYLAVSNYRYDFIYNNQQKVAHIHNSQHNQKFLNIVQTDQLSNIVTLNCLAKKNQNLNLRKNVQCSTENGDLLSFQDTNLINFQY